MPNIAALITVAAVMFAVLGAITLIAHIYNLNNIKSKTVGDGQHGTARWANKSEIRKAPTLKRLIPSGQRFSHFDKKTHPIAPRVRFSFPNSFPLFSSSVSTKVQISKSEN